MDPRGALIILPSQNFCNADSQLLKHQNVGEVANAPEELVYIRKDRFLFHSGAKMTNNKGSVKAVHHKPTRNHL